MIHLLRWVTVLFVLLITVSCHSKFGTVATPPTANQAKLMQASPSNSATFVSPDGIEITSLESQPNDMAEILGVSIWRLRVMPPKKGLDLNYTLELRRKGKAPEPLTSLTITPRSQEEAGSSDTAETLVALLPTTLSSGSASSDLKFYVRGGGSGAAGLASNPLKNLRNFNTSYSSLAELQKDGSLLLMHYTQGGGVVKPDRGSIVLTIKVAKSQKML